MKCPKCNGNIVDGCCIKCGYLSSGNMIHDKEIEKYEDEKLFNKDFYKLYNNKRLFLIFILGSLYFSYRGFLFTSIIVGLSNCFLYLCYYNIIDNSILTYAQLQMGIVYFVITRLLYVIFSNSACIMIDQIKISIYKKIYKNNYKEKLKKYKHQKYYLVVAILIYSLIFYLVFMSKKYY